jgi:hypothetical protein
MAKIFKQSLFSFIVGNVNADCGNADYRTIVGASAIYSVTSMVSDISLTTNDIAVGFSSYSADLNNLTSSIYYI